MFLAWGFTVLCGILGCFQPLYTQVDNYLVSLVTNRVYDTDNYCMFLNPVLCQVVGWMQKAFPNADSFTLLSRILILAGIWYLGYFVARYIHKTAEVMGIYLILFLFVINSSLFYDYFTIWSAYFGFVGMVLLLGSIKNTVWQSVAVGTFFMSCSVMYRLETAAIFLPFILLVLFIDFFVNSQTTEERRITGRTIGKVFGPAILCTVLLLMADYEIKHSERYKDGVAYNNSVCMSVDFPMKDYEAVKEELPGVSYNDYESLQYRLYADTDRVTSEYAKCIGEAGGKKAFDLNPEGIVSCLKTLLYAIASSKKTIFYWLLLLFFLLWIFLSNVSWYRKIELLMAYMGGGLIMLYFTFVGRVPLRVINSVTYALFGMVLTLYMAERWYCDYTLFCRGKNIFFILVTVVVIADTLSYGFVKPQSVWRVREGVDEKRWKSTYSEGALYLWQTHEFVQHPMRCFIDQGKLMTDTFMEHNLCYGEWTYGQVYYQNYLERLGVPNPMRALLERKNTYYVAEDNSRVFTYLKEHFDENVKVREVGKIDGISVWKFEIE